MLTIAQVKKLYEHDVKLKMKKGRVKLTMKKGRLEDKLGDYDPSKKEITIYGGNIRAIYGGNITSEPEMDKTILHEFIHARNDIIRHSENDDKNVEEEALKTYNKKPAVLGFIKQLYKIR